MPQSILSTIKKMLGLTDDYTPFDAEILVHINTSMMTLQQLGVGPKAGFRVTGYSETWDMLITDGSMMDGVKSYVFLCVKMAFDPPANSYVMTTMKESKDELEWRLRDQAELYPGDGTRLGYYQALPDETEEDSDDPVWPKGPDN